MYGWLHIALSFRLGSPVEDLREGRSIAGTIRLASEISPLFGGFQEVVGLAFMIIKEGRDTRSRPSVHLNRAIHVPRGMALGRMREGVRVKKKPYGRRWPRGCGWCRLDR
jgi:hypothetical protein